MKSYMCKIEIMPFPICPVTEAPGPLQALIKLGLPKGAQGANSPSCLLSHQDEPSLMGTRASF